MAFAAASAGAILSLPLAPPVKDSSTKDASNAGGGTGGAASSLGPKKAAPLSLVREQQQLEAWTAATVGLPVELSDDEVLDSSAYYVQSSKGSVYIDVGGVSHRVGLSNFRPCGVLPCSRLGRLFRSTTLEDALRHCDDIYAGDPPTIFFDRNATGFNTILDIYRTGKLHFTEKSCALVLKHDFDYWGIDEMMLEPCCALKYYPEMEVCSKEQEGERRAKRRMQEKMIEEDFGPTALGRARRRLWNLTEYPESGRDAQAAAFFSLAVVVVSTATFVLSTLEEFQTSPAKPSQDQWGNSSTNASSTSAPSTTASPADALVDKLGAPEDDDWSDGQLRFPAIIEALEVVDAMCIFYFTLEYLVRFLCAPRKFRFVIQAMNLVDLFAIIPFYLTIFLNRLEDVQIIGKAGKVIRLVRIMRILRVFKLVRHFAGLQSLVHTLHQAYKELGLLFFLISVTVLTVSCLVYFAERDEGIWSFVDSFWFALMTLTTVGYDLNPVTGLGKVTGGFCALLGVFILTLPIPIVVNSFASYYKNRLWRNEVAMKKKQRIAEQQERRKSRMSDASKRSRRTNGSGSNKEAGDDTDDEATSSSGPQIYGIEDEDVPLAMRKRKRMEEEKQQRNIRRKLLQLKMEEEERQRQLEEQQLQMEQQQQQQHQHQQQEQRVDVHANGEDKIRFADDEEETDDEQTALKDVVAK